MAGINTLSEATILNERTGKAVKFVPQGTWLVSSGDGLTLANPQAAAGLSEADRLLLSESGISLDGDIFIIPEILLPLEQTFYPPIPEPQHKDDQPPERSTELLVSANPVDELFVETSEGKYFPTSGEFKGLPVRVEPPFPPTAKLAYRRFWQNTFTITILNAQNFTRAIETQVGMSEEDTTSLSRKLGLVDFIQKLPVQLSAELSKTTTHTVTITESRKITETYNFSVEEGKVAIYTLWQLVELFALVDENNNPIDWSGEVILKLPLVGDMERDAKFPPDRHTNHAERYATSLHTFDI